MNVSSPDARIERLLGEIERTDDDDARERARALVEAVLDWHKAGLARLLEVLRARGDAARPLVADLAADPLVRSTFELHELELVVTRGDLVPVERLVRGPAAGDVCEVCGAALGREHNHLFDPTSRALRCACEACGRTEIARLGVSWKSVSPRADAAAVVWTDAEWDRLGIPIGLAFFQKSSVADRTVAYYPSPAGAVESIIGSDAWNDLVHEHPQLQGLRPDVEALLVHRTGAARDYYFVSIDLAYELVGQMRRDWRGLSGGPLLWQGVTAFFERLKSGRCAHA